MSEDEKALNYIATELADFFKDDPRKITYWLMTCNQNFGGISPAKLAFMRDDGLTRLAQIIKGLREGNFA